MLDFTRHLGPNAATADKPLLCELNQYGIFIHEAAILIAQLSDGPVCAIAQGA